METEIFNYINQQNRKYIGDLSKYIQNHNVILFIGAGLSCPLYPSWPNYLYDLLPPYEVRLKNMLNGLLGGETKKYEEAAQLISDRLGAIFVDKTKSTFDETMLKEDALNESAALLPKLCCNAIFTTNFDRTIEYIYKKEGITIEVVPSGYSELVQHYIAQGTAFLWKIHGDINDSESWVLTAKKYDSLYSLSENPNERSFINDIDDYLRNKVFLFIGCSLESDRIVTLLQQLYMKNNRIKHFAILPMPQDVDTLSDRASFLGNMGVLPIWYPEGQYKEIPKIITDIVKTAGVESANIVSYTKNIVPLSKVYVKKSETLRAIREKLMQNRTVIISGSQGIGKTEMAAQFVESNKDLYKTVVWIKADKIQGMKKEASIYYKLATGIDVDFSEAFNKFSDMLENSKDYLIVFDDVHDEKVLELIYSLDFKNGYGIITSFMSSFDLYNRNVVELKPLNENESWQLFSNITCNSYANSPDKNAFLKLFSGVPLAIVQAALYINQSKMPLKTYINNFESCITNEKNFSGKRHKGIYGTLKMSFDKIIGKDRDLHTDLNGVLYVDAGNILKFCSFLSYNGISHSLLLSFIDGIDDCRFYNALSLIFSYGLLRDEDETLYILEINQTIIRYVLESENNMMCSEMIRNISNKISTLLLERDLVSTEAADITDIVIHAEYLLSIDSKNSILPEVRVILACGVGNYYFLKGDFKTALQYFEKYLNTEQLSEQQNLMSFDGLLRTFEALGSDHKALDLLNQVFSNLKKVGCMRNICYPQILQTKAYLLQNIGNLDESTAVANEILEYSENNCKECIFDKSSLVKAKAYSCAGTNVKHTAGLEYDRRMELAIDFYEKSLREINVSIYDTDLHHVRYKSFAAQMFMNLFLSCNYTGRKDLCKMLYTKSEGLLNSIYHEGHIDYIFLYNAMGAILLDERVFDGANKEFEKAIEMSKKLKCESYPVMIYLYMNYATSCLFVKEFDKAEDLFNKALILIKNFQETKVLGEQKNNAEILLKCAKQRIVPAV